MGLNPIAVTFIAAFDYFDKTSLFWVAISKGISIICFVSVIEALRNSKCKFLSCIFLITGIIKKLLNAIQLEIKNKT